MSTEQIRPVVETKLIRSACVLLAQRGPKSLTIRDVAKHAGVNHGQIHHHFGSKNNLLKIALKQLEDEHFAHYQELMVSEESRPAPFSLSNDQEYIMAITRCVLDGQSDLATLNRDSKSNVPKSIVKRLTDRLGSKATSAEIKAAIAVAMALEWSWATLGPYIVETLEIDESELPHVKKQLGITSRQPVDKLMAML